MADAGLVGSEAGLYAGILDFPPFAVIRNDLFGTVDLVANNIDPVTGLQTVDFVTFYGLPFPGPYAEYIAPDH